MFEIFPHTETAGAVCLSKDGAPLSSLTRDFILASVSKYGYLVFRGFDANIGEFSRLVRASSKRMCLDPARTFNGSVAQKVDAGYGPVGLHCENGNSPFWPDLCWFYCERSPSVGSQTTICDGYAVFKEMDQKARKLFIEHDIVYSRKVDVGHWKNYVLHTMAERDNAPKDVQQVNFHHLVALVDNPSTAKLTENMDGSISYSFKTPAARRSHLSGKTDLAFANSIFGPSYNYETPIIMFDDGTHIPESLLEEVGGLCDRHTREVGWQDHDVVLLDNTRVMHGRHRIEDPRRVIYNALSYS